MNCSTFIATPKDTMMALPTGDGMAIGFLQGLAISTNVINDLNLQNKK